MTALPQAALPLLRPRRAKKVLYGRKQRQDHNGAWGELLPGSFDNVGLALRFIGGYGVRTDLETGLLWMRHRWYDATLQRFISRDPIGLEGGDNLYIYVDNAPVDFEDIFGLRPRRRGKRWRETKNLPSPRTEAQQRLSEWFGRPDFYLNQYDVHRGAQELYRSGFHWEPEAGQKANVSPRYTRFLRFRKEDCPGKPIFVIFDYGQPVKGEYRNERRAHWKILSNGKTYNSRGEEAHEHSKAAHIPAPMPELFEVAPNVFWPRLPELRTKAEAMRPRWVGPARRNWTISPNYPPGEI